ncbi:MAG: hypothetical protein ALECFALPRED_009743 [Alectoria fallacina]|uniref:Uncharacterized protein n=1 Tax=Alectoria fallacina TaxID=1903189 RepID=A0A8H3J866_9LECA|nr:MAG: hypothetical protein ALECFALPRED_009743 [Alectoria fallacina]
MDNPSSMGSLYCLPTEVRMDIYRLVLPQQRRAILPISTLLHQRYEVESLVHPDTAIFQTSKAISGEAIDVFYSERVFKIDMWNLTQPLDTKYHVAHPGLSLIQNVHIRMDMMMYDELYEDDAEYEASVCRSIILGFGGLETPRNTLRLTLEIDGWSDLSVVKTIFFQDFATMTGFRNVIIESRPRFSVPSTKLTSWYEKKFEKAGKFGSNIVEELAPTLGPGVVEFRWPVSHVEFQPRAHLAGNAAGKRRGLP